MLAPGALLASNTSTLPITGLAEGVRRPADFIGMHFFSPVGKMPLLEIVVGEQTRRRGASPAPSTWAGGSARRRSWSTTAAASSPAG